MRKKISISKERWFQIINTVIVVAILSFYVGRLFYFKNKMTITYSDSTSDTLANILIARNDSLKEDRLYENEDGSYSYKGNVTDNYCFYENRLYRIVSIDKDKNVKIVSQDSITTFTMSEDSSFLDSNLYVWLNKTSDTTSGVYYKNLSNKSNIIDAQYDVAVIDDIKQYQPEYSKQKVSILSMEDYVNAGSELSYLVNGEKFWLSNCDSNYSYYYVDENGAIGTAFSANQLSGVRPVLTLDASLTAIKGSGTESDPYVLYTKIQANNIGLTKPFDYISYSGYNWIVQFKDSGNAVAIMDGLLEEERTFGRVNYLTKKSGLGYYLNNDFLSSLDNYDKYLLERDWDFGSFDQIDNFDYQNNSNDYFTGYVSIPTIATLSLSGYDNFYLANNSIQSEDLIFVYKDSLLYSNFIDDYASVRPVICFNKEVKIVSGDGSFDSPYVLEVIE